MISGSTWGVFVVMSWLICCIMLPFHGDVVFPTRNQNGVVMVCQKIRGIPNWDPLMLKSWTWRKPPFSEKFIWFLRHFLVLALGKSLGSCMGLIPASRSCSQSELGKPSRWRASAIDGRVDLSLSMGTLWQWLTWRTGKIHHFQWAYPLFLWSFSMAMFNYQRVCYMILHLQSSCEKMRKE